jgi:hypothetical protein
MTAFRLMSCKVQGYSAHAHALLPTARVGRYGFQPHRRADGVGDANHARMAAQAQAAAFGRAEATRYEVEEETNSFGKDAFDVLALIGAAVWTAVLQHKFNNGGKSKGSSVGGSPKKDWSGYVMDGCRLVDLKRGGICVEPTKSITGPDGDLISLP